MAVSSFNPLDPANTAATPTTEHPATGAPTTGTLAADAPAPDSPPAPRQRTCPDGARERVSALIKRLGGVAYGADYNPEQWPREVWREDVALMREAGVNLVSVGIFAWARLEPSPGVFDFEWLDELLDLLHENGISVDLATPTVVPPAWFYRANPQARAVLADGTPVSHGSRGILCPSSPEYREATARITHALGERYGAHPAVAMWHVHNEYGAPITESFSDYAQADFRSWLQARYGTLEALNTAWGTTFWGQIYGDWEEIIPPLVTGTEPNPALQLDWKRFSSDAQLRCFIHERDILREYSPNLPITTNFMAHNCDTSDLWRWGREVDVSTNDHYLLPEDPSRHIELAMAADLTRSLGDGGPWILLEHSTSGVNWRPRNVAKTPGEMARNSLSHFGRGADGIMFFQWRASRFGAEKFHSAMVPHAGRDSRVFREVCALGSALSDAADAAGSGVRNRVAILWDYESLWAQHLPWRPTVDLGFREQIRAWYERLWRDHVGVDFAHPEFDLSGYDLVLAPSSYLLTDAAAANLRAYVEGGGKLVVGPFCGIVDGNDTVRPGGLNAALADVCGVSVEEFCPLPEGADAGLDWVSGDAAGTAARAPIWCDDLRVTTGEVLAEFTDGPVPGGAAVVRNSFGAGTAWHVGCVLSPADLAPLMADVYAEAGIVLPDYPEGVEVLPRLGEDGSEWAVLINHTPNKAEVTPAGWPEPVRLAAGASGIFRRP
ncbi:beta-galactosidase [Dermabacteraceae bacterium P13136]